MGAILVLSLVVRVVLVLGSRHSFVPVFDSGDYNRIAVSLSHGHGFGPTTLPRAQGASAFRTPLWPAVLALVYVVAGTSWTAARLFLALCSTGLIAVLGALGWRVAGRRVGLVAMLLGAIYPPLLLAGYSLNYEVLMASFVGLALLAGLRWRDRPQTWAWLAVAGVLSGLAILCRENAGFVLVPIWICIVQGRRSRSPSKSLRLLLIVTGFALVTILPWTIRNAVRLDAFIPVSDGAGWTFAGAYNTTAEHIVNNPETMFVVPLQDPADRAAVMRLGPRPSEAQLTSSLQSNGLHYLLAHPGYVPRLAASNTIHLFDLGGLHDSNWLAEKIPWPRRLIELSVASFYVVGLLALGGLFTRRGRSIPKAIWMFPVLWTLSVVLSVAVMQYRLVVEPFIVILAAIALVTLFDKIRHRQPHMNGIAGEDA